MTLWHPAEPFNRRSFLSSALTMAFWGMMSSTMLPAIGCSPTDADHISGSQDQTETTEAADPPSIDDSNPMQSAQPGQRLPISAIAEIGGHEIALEVASTPRQQALGLMFREPLPDNQGMLFPMGSPRSVSFWMKNVPGSLDMVFIYNGTIQAIAANVPPCEADPCPTYGPGSQLIDHVIELRGGHAAELGLATGDTVVISPVTP